ncbi:Dynamin domain-containing protein [Desulfonema limicola]|uniref:Dynamin domain-containing protein n=1 Tax=Desulfonema limicola TaxID=45656 RepID=A0A975GJK6_9BACT|nr:dynamin family protein [Desulfonema limicola]QTA83801.1 Dynamin domain-containing protein [Desulfonema limicola]
MIGKQYKAHKDNVIDLFNKYKTKRGDLDDGIDIKFLENRIDSLRKGKFTLAVAGEVKAGKSTFINALLGAEILPSDVLQASSAIVEVSKSETSFLKVKYADGKNELIDSDLETTGIDKINERLHEICKIHDEYRQIPTTLIDDYIIACDGVLTINEDFVKYLEQKTGEHLQDKHSVIEKYILEKTKDKIPVEIEFGYPLKWDFDELRIVDSPGVNAIGGVQDVSFRFFEEANAILFVHPIKPIESESFRRFVDSVITNRSKETLFLILTHAGLYSNDDVERLHVEAKRLYKNVIPESRILVVDSLLQLIIKDFENGKTQDEIEKASEQKEDILPKFEKKAKKEGTDLVSQLKKHSRFELMFAAIDEFSMKAPNLQLQEILEKIKAGYEDQENQYTEKAERLEKKKRNPQEFEEEINRINEALEKYKLLTKQTKEDLKSNYSGRHSTWQKVIDELKVKYPELITESNNIDSARKHTVDAQNALNDKVNDFSKELTQRLGEALEEAGKAFKKEHQISIPIVDIEALEEKARKSAYKEEDTYEWRKHSIWKFWKWFNRDYKVKTGTRKVFDDKKFLGEYKTKFNEKFYKIVNDLPNISKEVLDIYLNLFSKEIDSAIGDRQKALEKEKEKKQSNEEIISEIKELGRKKKDIQSEKSLCIEVLEDIK